MSFWPALATWQFALAGALCASAPVIIHLLHRRRYRQVEWAAMQFLLEAVQRNRRIMQLRDLLLLVLRTAAVALFGLALAQPYFSTRHESLQAGQPVHAVLLVDNSLSMNYQMLSGSLLEQAKAQAAALIDRLPVGSRISVIPLCGSQQPLATEPFDAKPLALEAVRRIEAVDRSATIERAVQEALRAAAALPDLTPRVVLFSDQQQLNWQGITARDLPANVPAIQLVRIAADDYENSWVDKLELSDGIADTETPAVIRTELRHQGTMPRENVRVALFVEGREVDSQIVSFPTRDSIREITFEHSFAEAQPEPSRASFVAVKVALSPDRLVADDERHLLVPVVTALPVVFVDQLGDLESPVENRLGETRHLRQLLAPRSSRAEIARRLIDIRHRRVEQLDRDTLADARLVVMAGVPHPGAQVELLREYVEQGGQLVLAAGASFDPVAWNEAAWKEGLGILPLPLAPGFHGSLPELAGESLRPFHLSFESFGSHPYFQLAGNSEPNLRDLYAEPFFFQAVRMDTSPAVLEQLRDVTLERLRRDAPKSFQASEAKPHWLGWAPPDRESGEVESKGNQQGREQEVDQGQLERLAQALQPQVLARFTSETGPPFLVERRIGHGRVLFVTSGFLSSWNTLPKTNAIILFDRILRSLIRSTLPQRDFAGVEQLVIPIPQDLRVAPLALDRPGNETEESLDTGYSSRSRLGVTIERPLTRGIYRVSTLAPAPDGTEANPTSRKWSAEVSVQGDRDESDLTPLPRDRFEQQFAGDAWRWVDGPSDISLAGAHVRGQDLWWWLALSVLVLLLAELVILVASGRGRTGEGPRSAPSGRKDALSRDATSGRGPIARSRLQAEVR